MHCSPWGCKELGTTERLNTNGSVTVEGSKGYCLRMYAYCCFLKILVYYFWMFWVFIAMRRHLTVVTSLVAERRLQVLKLQQVQLAGPGHRLQVLWHAGSSWTRDRTPVPCVRRQTVIS